MTHEPIAYTYDADTHCPACAEERFGRGADGFIASSGSEDSEGNPVGVIFPWGEIDPEGYGIVLVCGTCRASRLG